MRLRLILSFALIVMISVGSVVFLARVSTASEVRAFMFRGGMTGVEGLVSSLENHYRENAGWQGVENLLLQAPGHMQGRGHGGPGMEGMGNMLDQRLRLANPAGDILVDTAGEASGARLSRSELERAIPLRVQNQTVGYLLPEGGMAFSANDELALLNRLNRTALTAGLIAGAFSLLLASLLAYTLVRPVRDLTRAASSLAHGDLDQRVSAAGDDELAELGRAFNHMATSLQKAQEDRRAMTADIAHELRTPLSVQRAHLEALQDGIYPLSPGNLEPVLEQNQLLTRLVEDLRTLALADAGGLVLERAPMDLSASVAGVVERFRPQAEARNLALQLVQPAENGATPLVFVDRHRVGQILSNLLANALQYTPEGGRVSLELSHSNDGVQLTVHDSGPGIPEEALPYIFERFYRADRSRSRAAGGSGLGLSIARQLAEAHGGMLVAANHPQGGAIFTLSLPAGGD